MMSVPLSTDTSMFSFENPAIAIDSLYVSSSNLRRSYGGYDCEFVLCAVFKRPNSLLKPIKKDH